MNKRFLLFIFMLFSTLFFSCNDIDGIRANKDKLLVKIQITEDESLYHVILKIFDDEGFIYDEKNLKLNGTPFKLSKTPNGYYGNFVQYYLGSFNNPELFADGRELLFTYEKEGKEIILARVDKRLQIKKSNYKFQKLGKSQWVEWSNNPFTKLNISVIGKDGNESKEIHYKELELSSSGSFGVQLKYIKDFTQFNKIVFDFTDTFSQKLDNFSQGSSLEYKRRFYKAIYLKDSK